MSVATEPRLIRVPEAAQLLGVSHQYVRDLVASGELPSVRFGDRGWIRFNIEDVQRFIRGEEQSHE